MSRMVSAFRVGTYSLSDTSVEAVIGSHITPQSDGCWRWGDGSADYPTAKIHGKTRTVHRWIYFLMNDDLDENQYRDHHLHHRCMNKGCVNPKHLVPLTPAEHKAAHAELEGAA